MAQKVRVLFAVSSPLTVKVLERLLTGASDIEIVGFAKGTSEALTLAATSSPHLFCIDDTLPNIDALELTREVMHTQARPILVLSGTQSAERRKAILELGALDVISRPNLVGASTNAKGEADRFVARLKMLSRVPVIGRRPAGHLAPPLLASPPPRVSSPPLTTSSDDASRRIIAIGASTGGPPALLTILSALPANFPHPIVCVQHVSRGFLEGLVSWFNDGCRLHVTIAEEGAKVRAGTVLFPPENRHLEVGSSGRISLSQGPPRDGHRPSVTVLFESVAASYGTRATAILLTGMGADGAEGLVAVHEAGGDTIAQNEASCVVYGMPRVAIERGAARHVCSPEEIARRLPFIK